MATNTNPVFEKDPYVQEASYTNADAAATKKDLVPTADVPAEGLRLDSITLASTDTSARVIRFYQHDGTNPYLIGAVSVTALAGSDGSAVLIEAISVLAPLTGYICIPSGSKLQVENVAQVTAAKQIDIVARGGKYTA